MAEKGSAGHGSAQQGRAGHGTAWHGRARQGREGQGRAGQPPPRYKASVNTDGPCGGKRATHRHTQAQTPAAGPYTQDGAGEG